MNFYIYFCFVLHSVESAERSSDTAVTQSKERTTVTGKAVHHSASNVAGQKQKQGQNHGHKTVLRRKVVPSKPKVPQRIEPAALKQQQPQTVINRARGTLHGLSTIKRHGNVRVTPNADYLAV